jgi:hypothetical protein
MLKLADNPPSLFPEGTSIAAIPGRWWVGHTKARFEKAFAWDLMSRGIGYFLPMIQKTTFSGGRKRRVMTPLFSGYVFFAGDEQVRYEALLTDRLCQVIPVIDQAGLCAELAQLQTALAGSARLDPYPFAAVGQRCRIAAGPFMGLEGVVVRREKMATIVLRVGILGQGAALEVDASLLEEGQ